MRFEIEKTPYFDVGQTLNCGQVFRFTEDKDGYTVFALDHIARIEDKGECYSFDCDDAEFFKRYFDFDTDYGFIQSKTADKGLISSAIEFGRGIHILRQNPIETVFSFLISQNNHIPRIKGIIERMCAGLGKNMGGYYAFPTVEALANAGEEYFASIGAGYRAAYLDRTAKALLNQDAAAFEGLNTAELRNTLMGLHGVGRKVADCILLFGFNRFDVFPVDTWIKKIFEESYPNVPAEKLSVLLVEKYGEYAGFVQQWLFYYKRELDRKQPNLKKL